MYVEAFIRLTLLYELTWGDVMYVLGQTLTPDLRALVLREATTFGDKWLECETREKREHKISLLPAGSQAVPIRVTLSYVFLKDLSKCMLRL